MGRPRSDGRRERVVMTSDILVVYKKNFEDVHDKSLERVRESLDELVRDRGTAITFKARETVTREDLSLIHI